MGIVAKMGTIDKEHLDSLAISYKEDKNEATLTRVIFILEPLIRGKVISCIYYHEKYRSRHMSDFEDLCQEARLKVVSALNRWIKEKGSFYTCVNFVIGTHLKRLMKSKHKMQKRMICDYSNSLSDFLYSDEVGAMRLSDKISEVDVISGWQQNASPEKIVEALQLGEVISKAISEEFFKSRISPRIFKLYLAGDKLPIIAKKVRKPEWLVRHKIGYVVKKVRRKLSAKYLEMYKDLLPDFSGLVKIDCSCLVEN